MISRDARIGNDVEHGDNFKVRDFATLKGKNIIGDRVDIYQYANVGMGTVIEDDVYFGMRASTLNTRKIIYHRKGMAPRAAQEPVIIRRGARIASHALILPGVEIGEETLVGAASVVTKHTFPYGIYYGNPAEWKGWVPPEEYLVPPVDNPKRIYIMGCAKTGTTLLLRLFHAFKDVRVIEREIGLGPFLKWRSSLPVIVGKRAGLSLFSNTLPKGKDKVQRNILESNDIKVIVLVRDPADVMESRYVSAQRYLDSMAQIEGMPQADWLTAIQYENLVENPDEIQEGIAHWLGLEIEHKWSEYPAFFPEASRRLLIDPEGPNSLRPINTDRIGKGYNWKRQATPVQVREITKIMQEWRYA